MVKPWWSRKPWWSHLVANVLSQAGRIQELRLDVPYEILPTELSLNTPRLQILDISLWGYHSERTLMINNGNSLLRTIKLAHCPLPWHSIFNLSGVTTLSLRELPSPSQQNIPEFLTTLGRLQALTVLQIEDTLPSAHGFLPSGAFDVSPKVTLPCLTLLVIHAPLSTVIALLSHVGIPLTTQVRLKIQSEDESSIDDYAQLPSLVAPRFSQFENSSSSCPIIRSLTIHFTNDSLFNFNASERSDCDASLPSWHGPQDRSIPLCILVIMKRSIAISYRARIIGDICCAIPSTHVETLHIINPPSSLDFWRKTLGHLDGLRCMKLSYGSMPNLVSLLSSSADALVDAKFSDHNDRPVDAISSNHGRTRHTFVPALEELKLHYVMFSSEDDLSLLNALSTYRALDLTVTQCEIRVEEDE